MRKIFKIKNLGWVIAGILFLILVFRILQSRTPAVIVKENISVTPTAKQEIIELIKVVDGDTIIVKINGEEKSVRLIGIDTPEKDECFEKEATKKAKELMENKKIKLEADSSQDDNDKYGRLLRYIYLEDGTFVNEKLVEEGFGRNTLIKLLINFKQNLEK